MQDGDFNIDALKEDSAASGGGAGAGSGAGAGAGGGGTETPEQKAEREKTEAAAAGGGGGTETPEQKAEREKTEALANETPEQKAEREKTEALANETPEAKIAREKIEKEQKLAKDKWQQEMFATLGVKNIEELNAKLKPPAVETPEQKEARLDREKASIDSYATTNNILTRAEIITLEKDNATPDEDLVFAAYEKQQKEKNKDILAETIKQNFRLLYHLDSTEDTLKEVGAGLLKNAADDLRKPLNEKYETAKQDYTDKQQSLGKMPAFKTFIQTSMVELIPEKITLTGKDSEAVTFDIPKTIVPELEKFLVTNDLFDLFNSDSQQAKALVKDKIDGFLFLKHREQMFKTVYDAGISAGTEQGSTTGATAPFNVGAGGGAGAGGAETELSAEETARAGTLLG